MMRYGLSLTSPLVFLLLACGGGGGGSSCAGDCLEPPIGTGPCENPVQLFYYPPPWTNGVTIGEGDVVINLISTGGIELRIYGSGVACGLNVETSNNLIRFETDTVSINDCRINGNDNVIERPESMELTCEDTGLGNALFVY